MMIELKKSVRKILEFIGYRILSWSKLVYMSNQEKRVIPWVKDSGDKTLRLNYNLNESSLVFDLGGYEGQWASDIFSMYCCNIHIFEPVLEFSENIKNKFRMNTKIIIHNFGLSNESKTCNIFINKDESSIFKKGGDNKITLIKAIDFFKNNQFGKIDLMKVNIEGGEYDLLEHLIETKFIYNIENLQVQFHDFVPDAEQRMKVIQNRLNQTHFLSYHYPFIWENWSRKNIGDLDTN